jgi:hypothetical protein
LRNKAIEDRIVNANDKFKSEKKNFENATVENRRNFIKSTDMQVLNFELKRIPK